MAVFLLGPGAAHAGDPLGTWVMSDGKVTVRLSKCSAKLCLRLAGLKEPLDKEGRPKLDKLNPDPALRGRPLIGLLLASGLVATGRNAWRGSIYNPDDGLTYAVLLKLNGQEMAVKGCVAGVMCKTHSFRRR
ncbi:MAG: DUF2147 domain-containing protein [Rhizobiales bacterium]|nr:DUF2147 domain-containing protein [Hyphomicrobiales bacterium]